MSDEIPPLHPLDDEPSPEDEEHHSDNDQVAIALVELYEDNNDVEIGKTSLIPRNPDARKAHRNDPIDIDLSVLDVLLTKIKYKMKTAVYKTLDELLERAGELTIPCIDISWTIATDHLSKYISILIPGECSTVPDNFNFISNDGGFFDDVEIDTNSSIPRNPYGHQAHPHDPIDTDLSDLDVILKTLRLEIELALYIAFFIKLREERELALPSIHIRCTIATDHNTKYFSTYFPRKKYTHDPEVLDYMRGYLW